MVCCGLIPFRSITSRQRASFLRRHFIPLFSLVFSFFFLRIRSAKLANNVLHSEKVWSIYESGFLIYESREGDSTISVITSIYLLKQQYTLHVLIYLCTSFLIFPEKYTACQICDASFNSLQTVLIL